MFSRYLLTGVIAVTGVIVCCEAAHGKAQATCCPRTVGVSVEVQIADQEEESVSFYSPRIFRNAVESVFLRSEAELTDCPLSVDFLNIEGMHFLSELIDAISEASGARPDRIDPLTNFDYLIVGIVSRDDKSGVDSLALSLVDNEHGQIVRKGKTAWKVPTTHQDVVERRAQVGKLAKSFMPLDDILHKYEAMPQSARLEPEEEVIGSGQKMEIALNQILDSYGKASKPWQYVVVKLDKGELTNGTKQDDDSYRFKVGDGQITLAYKAPDECKDQTEKVTVFNSCQSDPAPARNILPEDKIASTEFKIRCVRGTFEFKWEGTTEGRAGGKRVISKYAESGEVPFDVEWKDGEGTFEAEEDVRGGFTITVENFRHSENYTAKHVLKGEVLAPESGESQLKVYWERHISGEEIPQCEMILPLRDGTEREFPVRFSGSGWTHESTYTVTLHLESDD